MISNERKETLQAAGYWVSDANIQLYDALVSYMKKHNLKQKDLAKELGISRGRLSQILNDGEINFSLEKFFGIAIKIGLIPKLDLIPLGEYIAYEDKQLSKRPVMQ